MRAVLPACRAGGIRIVTNMGAANPLAAAEATREVARSLGLGGLRIAAVTGDDVLDEILGGDHRIEETGGTLADLGDRLVSANAYLGAEPDRRGAGAAAPTSSITGRRGRPGAVPRPPRPRVRLGLGRLGRGSGAGTLVGHLLECAGQVTGGYFADPGAKDVPDLARLGFPIGEVERGRRAS